MSFPERLLRLASALVGQTEVEHVTLDALSALQKDPSETWLLLVRQAGAYIGFSTHPVNHGNLRALAARACAHDTALDLSRIVNALIPFHSEPVWTARRGAERRPEIVLAVWAESGLTGPTRLELESAVELVAAAVGSASEVARLRHQSQTDVLTNVLNRRGIMDALEREQERAGRHGYSVAVLVADLDDFKVVNDTYGHAHGDRALEILASTLRAGLRASDLVGRIGGDEFLAVLPHCTVAEAELVARRLANEVAATPVVGEDGARFHVRATIGASGTDIDGHDLVDLADQRMLCGKRQRRPDSIIEEPAAVLAVAN
jgi:diguanylate cyclase (GGDEF)-like protein